MIFALNNKKATPTYDSYQLEEDFHPPAGDLKGNLLKIKPYKDNDGIKAGANLLQTLHDVYIENGKNKSDSHAFEVWFDKGRFKFRLYAGNPRAEERFKRRVDNVYTNSEVEAVEHATALPKINKDYYVSGTRLDENRHTFVPIRHAEGSGFLQDDPYSDILGEMSTLDDSITILQVVFRPARQDWTENGPDGRSVDEVANDLRAGHVESLWNLSAWLPWHEIEEYEATEKEKRAAKLVQEQRGEQGFHVDIRILAASPNRREAIERSRGVSRLFTNIYSGEAQQRLVDHPVDPDDMLGFLERMTDRTWIDEEMILSLDELAGVAHIPNKDIEVPQIKWKTTKSGSDVDADSDKDPTERDRPEQSPLAQKEEENIDRRDLGLSDGPDPIREEEESGDPELPPPADYNQSEKRKVGQIGGSPEADPEQDSGQEPEQEPASDHQHEQEVEQDPERKGIAARANEDTPSGSESSHPPDGSKAEEGIASAEDPNSGGRTQQREADREADAPTQDGKEDAPTKDTDEVTEQLMKALELSDGIDEVDEDQIKDFVQKLPNTNNDDDSSADDPNDNKAVREESTPNTEGESASPIEADGSPQDQDTPQPEGVADNGPEQGDEGQDKGRTEQQENAESGEDNLPQSSDNKGQEDMTGESPQEDEDEDMAGML